MTMEPSCPSSTDDKDLDGFTMFASGDHDPTGDLWSFDGPDAIKSISSVQVVEDPLDVLLSPPVQQYLEQEDNPDNSSSSAPAIPMARSFVRLPSSREDSLFLAHLMLSGNHDDEYEKYESQRSIALEGPPSFASVAPKGRRLLGAPREDSLLIAQRILASNYDEEYEPQYLTFKALEDDEKDDDDDPDVSGNDSASSLPLLIQDSVSEKQDTKKDKNPVAPTQSVGRIPSKRKKKPKSVSPWTEDETSLDQAVTDIQDIDVLFGKGGKINKHVGNLQYHQKKKSLQKEYLHEKTAKSRKRELVQQLYSIVIEDWGGRFLCRKQGNEDDWFQAQQDAALEKCRQALATPERSREERAARRRMFLEKKKTKKTSSPKKTGTKK